MTEPRTLSDQSAFADYPVSARMAYGLLRAEQEDVERLRHERDDLLRIMWRCHCAMEDGVPLPFNRWLMDEGPANLTEDCRVLRDAYDTAGEERL